MVKNCTGERLVKIETTLEYMKQQQQEQKILLENFIESADQKYASKITEKIVFSLIALITIGVLSALIKLVLTL